MYKGLDHQGCGVCSLQMRQEVTVMVRIKHSLQVLWLSVIKYIPLYPQCLTLQMAVLIFPDSKVHWMQICFPCCVLCSLCDNIIFLSLRKNVKYQYTNTARCASFCLKCEGNQVCSFMRDTNTNAVHSRSCWCVQRLHISAMPHCSAQLQHVSLTDNSPKSDFLLTYT